MIYPLKNIIISQRFKANPYQYGYGEFGHTGIDLACPIGTPVLAPVTGSVIGIGTNPNYVGGLFVIIREADGERWECYMGHLSKILVSFGQQVTQGQEIAKSGMTGQAYGAHVHFQVRHFNAGDLVNPEDLITNTGEITNGQEVVNAYVLGLHRQPENQQAIDANVGKPYQEFSDNMLKSEEWLTQNDVILRAYPEAQATISTQSGQITGLTQTVNEKQAEIDTLIDENSQLKAKLAQAGSDSVQLTALGTLLNWLIIRLGLKK